jgi:2-polyprenyl-3-methyl-5-hydroxy-6-metoxy-1,4-benzoquinol methylase
MELSKTDLDYFNSLDDFDRGRKNPLGLQQGNPRSENPRFWACFGGKPTFNGKSVMDLGCGYGSLAIDIAKSGANKVLGFDLNAERINFAKYSLDLYYPSLRSKVEFLNMDVRNHPFSQFDYVISKDTFEHIISLKITLSAVAKRLKEGGRIYATISPWNGPVGDHGLTKTIFHIRIPWLHVLMGEKLILNALNRTLKTKMKSIHELGFNMLSLAEYNKIFSQLGLSVVYSKINYDGSLPLHERIVLKALSLGARLPLICEFFCSNICIILERSNHVTQNP